jgi:hypothetical protein
MNCKVKSHTRNGKKVRSYTRGSGSNSKLSKLPKNHTMTQLRKLLSKKEM